MQITKFKGLRNTTAVDRFKPGELEVAQNVDIDDAERIVSRRGLTLVAAGDAHSTWADDGLFLFVQSAVLKRLHSNGSVTTVKALTSDRPVSYAGTAACAYYSNGVDRGRVVGGAWSCWGLDVPLAQPVATASIGTLPAGVYLYAVTYVRADGHESGTGLAGMIELSAQGGIQFSSMQVSNNAEVTNRYLYVSSPGGEVLYRAAVLNNVATTYLYSNDGTDTTVPLDTQHAGPPPAGDIVELYNGVAYVVRNGVVSYSRPYAQELFRPRDFLQFPGGVTMFAALNDGVFVATSERAWALRGETPDKMTSTELDLGGAVAGTAVRTTRAVLTARGEEDGAEPEQACVLWLSPRGVCAGYDDGTAENLTEEQYSIAVGARGAALLRSSRGYNSYVVATQGSASAYNAAI